MKQRLLVFIFVAAFLARVCLILLVGHYRQPTLWENGMIARHMAEGMGFAADFARPGGLTSWQAPAYPYLLLASWGVFGDTPVAYLVISLLQALAVSSVVFAIYRLAIRWYADPALALWAALISVAMPLYSWYPTRLHHTALVMAVHPWLLCAWFWLSERPSLRKALVTGGLTGLAGLAQPVLLPLYGVLAFSVALRSGIRRDWVVFRQVMMAGICVGLVLLPWTVRNYRVHHRLLLVKNSFGKELWMGNNPHATGTGYVEGGGREITAAYPPACDAIRTRISEMEMMDAMRDEAVAFIRQEPGRFVTRTLKKVAWFWTVTPSRLVRSQLGGEALRFRLLQTGYWMVFLVLMILGLRRTLRNREYLVVLAGFVAYYSLVYGLTHVGQARFRGEMEFIFIPAVAAGLHAAYNTTRRWAGRSILRPGGSA